MSQLIFNISTGMKTVSQRCRFVTSSYRNMLLAAVDFRNRFAERPYLCEELLEPDQVVVMALNLFQLVAGIFLGQIWGRIWAPSQFKNFPQIMVYIIPNLLALHFGKNFIKIWKKILIQILQMYENLHKNVNGNMFSFTFLWKSYMH